MPAGVSCVYCTQHAISIFSSSFRVCPRCMARITSRVATLSQHILRAGSPLGERQYAALLRMSRGREIVAAAAVAAAAVAAVAGYSAGYSAAAGRARAIVEEAPRASGG